MNDIRFKIGDRVRLLRGRDSVIVKITRIFKSVDGVVPPTDLFIVWRETPDPLTGSLIDTALLDEIAPLDPMEAERLRRRMAFEVASGYGRKK